MKNRLVELNRSFAEDGVVLLKSIFIDQVRLLESSISTAVQNPSPMARNTKDQHGQVVFFSDFFTYHKNNAIWNIATDETLVKTVANIAGSKTLRLFHDHILVKSGMAPETPWHQDRPYYLVDGPISCSLWLTPDFVPVKESLHFMRGSHKNGVEYMPVSFDKSELLGEDENFTILNDDELARLEKYGVLSFSLEPGDGLLFDNRIVHKAARSDQPASRRALSIRYLGDGANLTTRFVNATPPFNKLGLKVVEGGDLPEAWFPSVL